MHVYKNTEHTYCNIVHKMYKSIDEKKNQVTRNESMHTIILCEWCFEYECIIFIKTVFFIKQKHTTPAISSLPNHIVFIS